MGRRFTSLTACVVTIAALALCAAPPRADAAPHYKPPPRLTLRFLAAGHGDGIIIRTPSGAVLLVDAGRGHERRLGDNLVKRRLLPYLRKRGIKQLDAFFITHPHWDHFGDMPSLAAGVRVKRLYVNSDSVYRLGPYLGFAARTVLSRGAKLRFGKLQVEVLNPPAKQRHPRYVRGVIAHNNRSIVLRLRYGKTRILLTGDLMYGGERQLLVRGGLGRVDVLKLGHHGNRSTSARWLATLRPRWAIATCGDRWAHRVDVLTGALLRRLRRRGVKLLRTDRDGDVVVTTDGATVRVRTEPRMVHVPAWLARRRRAARHRRSRAPGKQ